MAYCLGRKIRALTPRQGNNRGVEQCIGIGRFKAPHMSGGRIAGNVSFLLYSDGFGDKITPKDMLGALGGGRIKEREEADKALRTLAKTGVRRGCRDNMSAIYLGCS